MLSLMIGLSQQTAVLSVASVWLVVCEREREGGDKQA